MGIDQLSANEQRAVRLASDALRSTLRGNWELGSKLVQRINDECGGEGVGRAVLVWSDTLIGRLPALNGKPVSFAFKNADSGRIDTDADQVPATVRWAGRIIAARAADDEPTWDALMAALPDDGTVIGEHVGALLQMVTLNLRHLGGRP